LDHFQLGDRYSDQSIAELAEIYAVDESDVEELCNTIGAELWRGTRTRLSRVTEETLIEQLVLMNRGA